MQKEKALVQNDKLEHPWIGTIKCNVATSFNGNLIMEYNVFKKLYESINSCWVIKIPLPPQPLLLKLKA